MNIIGFTVRLMWHGSIRAQPGNTLFLYVFAFLSAPQTNPYHSSPATSPSLLLFMFSHGRAPLYYVLWPSATFRSGVCVCPEHIAFMPSLHREPGGVCSVMEISLLFFFALCRSGFSIGSCDGHRPLLPNQQPTGEGAVFFLLLPWKAVLLYVVTY